MVASVDKSNKSDSYLCLTDANGLAKALEGEIRPLPDEAWAAALAPSGSNLSNLSS